MEEPRGDEWPAADATARPTTPVPTTDRSCSDRQQQGSVPNSQKEDSELPDMQKYCMIVFASAALCGCASHNLASWRNGVHEIKKKKVTVDGIEISYEEYGHGEVILFVHGFGASSHSWRRVATDLANNGWRCVSVDLMGFGCSAKPRNASYTLERQAELLRLFADVLQTPSVHLVGHSYGGGVCLVLLSELMHQSQPHLEIRSLTLVDTVCYPQEFPSFIKILRIPLINWMSLNLVPAKTSSRSILELCYYSHSKITEEAILEYASGLSTPEGHDALVATARNIMPDDMARLLESYRRIRIPALIIWGDHDRIIPLEFGKRLSKEIPRASLTVFSKCGHVPQEEFPEETARNISSFLRSVK